ncbi:hypothetical protein ES703_33445 [subsurface metagenome]
MSINLGDPATLTIINIVITIGSWIIAWVVLLSGLKIKVDALWTLFQMGATKGFLGSSYHLKKEEEDAIPDDLKNDLKRLSTKYKKHKGNVENLLLELTRHHIDLIASVAYECNIPLNKMMGLAAVYMSNL